MDIVVCVKRVPDLAEAELEIDGRSKRLDVSDLDQGINEWDNFAVEEAVRLKEAHGGKVTAVTVGDEEAEEVLRRALAMGADEALQLCDEAFEDGDPWTIATVLAKALEGRPCDLVLCGAISADGTSGHVGGMLAGLLGVPQVALATHLEVTEGKALVRHEVEGGLEREVELDLPAVVTVQTGINEPRYVSIRGIRKVADVEIPVKAAADLGLDAAAVGAAGSRVTVEEMFLPPAGEGAEILEGGTDEVVGKLVERLREKGGL
jgi:electron transfer flavoprotein beta subunit